ncbi:GNAT family N-acetyltransferase [Candidatus Bathyarchaeota archaeon]|nr:GNAT family N-acetyltransferase [Candidatus Bathyarchaeota archaeon]
MPKIVIRKMRRSDLNIVSELAMLANPFTTKEKYCKHILDELKENPDLSFVAVENGKVVGYVQAEVRNGEKAMLEDIAVAKEHQGKGIGKLLLDKELKTLKRKGARIVLAEVHYKCASAIPFYYKHNFRITGFVQDYFGIGHDTIILKLVLQ